MSATMRRLAMPVAGFACLLFSVAAEARDAIDFGELLPGSDTVRRFELKNDGLELGRGLEFLNHTSKYMSLDASQI